MAKDGLPSIYARNYIKWGNEPAGETTSTLVLTSPEKSFVDIRVYLPLPAQSSSDSLPISRLEWAFAGKSSSTPATQDQPPHTVWKHWVDSRHVEADKVKDEGDMLGQENGDVLERGAMVNPHTGLLTYYEESWDDVKLSPGQGNNTGWVLKCEQNVAGVETKGMIVRVGTQAQGILRLGKEISVARWVLENDGGWRRTISIGISQIWSGDFAVWSGVTQDQILVDQDLEWRCVENFEWT